MGKVTAFALKHLLVSLGFVVTLAAFVVIAMAFLYLSLGVNEQLLEKYLSEQIHRPVQIESIEAGWDGLLAELKAKGILVQHEDGSQSSLRLRELQVSVDPLYLLSGNLRVEKTVLYGLSLEAVRQTDGTIQLGDFTFNDKDTSHPADFSWLLRQGAAEIRDGKIIWRDKKDEGHPIAVTEFNVETRSTGEKIRFTGRASPPTELGNQIYFNGVTDGLPLNGGAWGGDINVSVSRLNIEQLPLIVRELLPWHTKGLADMRVKTRWQDGSMTYANAEVELSRFVLPLGKDRNVVPIQKFTSVITWRGYPDAWSLSCKDPKLAVNGRWLRAKNFKVDYADNIHNYSAEGVRVHEILGVLSQLETSFPWWDEIRKSRAHGEIQNISATTEGSLFAPQRWTIEGKFKEVTSVPFGGVPGVNGLEGSLYIQPAMGWVNIDSENIEINSPRTFGQPLPLHRLQGRISWKKDEHDLNINIADLQVDSPHLHDGRGQVNLQVFDDKTRPPQVSGRFSVREMEVKHFWRYLPRGPVPDKTVNWFKEALLGGAFADLRVTLDGDVKRFPFRSGGGSFSLVTNVVDGRFHYQDRWPDIDELQGTLKIDNTGLKGEVVSAKFNQSIARQGRVSSDDIFSRNKEISIDAGLSAPAEDVVRFLTEGPLLARKSALKVEAAGKGELDLDIFLPLSDIKNRLKVTGRYAARDVTLTIQDRFVLDGLSGEIEFTDTTVESQGISGQFMGGDVLISIETKEPGRPPTWVARAQGQVDSARLVPLLNSRVVADNVRGATSWTGSMTAKPGRTTLEIKSDLNGVEITLPEPLSKHNNEDQPATFAASFEGGQQNFRFQIDPLVGLLEYRKRNSDPFTLDKGVLALGKDNVTLGPDHGFRVAISQPRFNADKWLSLLDAGEENTVKQNETLLSGLRKVDLDTAELHLFGRDWDRVRARASTSDGLDWKAWISGDALIGEVALQIDRGDRPDRYTLDFDRLHVPRVTGTDSKGTSPDEPNQYPDLVVHADDFKYGDWDLGRLEMAADRSADKWRIKKLELDQPGLEVKAQGHWGKNASGPITRIEAAVHSSDVTIALDKLQLPPHMAESDVQLQLDLNWADDPMDFKLEGLNGDFDINAAEGQFLNVEPGSGRLLGLFNIDAISRRFSLDFSDIFSKGLAFDQIKGQGHISAGNLYTEGLFVVGPSALVEIDGRAGLASEDYDLEVFVVPQLGSHISILSTLANPIAGAMVFIAQKVMKKTFDKLLAEMAHYRYQIQGSWEDPVITAVLLEPATEEEAMR